MGHVCSILLLTSCTVSKALLDLMAILWPFLVESAEILCLSTKQWPQSHTGLLTFTFAQHWGQIFNAGMLITYNLPFSQVKKLYRAQQWSSNKKSKFKKHHVAYGALHIESALCMRTCVWEAVQRGWARWLVLVRGSEKWPLPWKKNEKIYNSWKKQHQTIM